MEVQELIDILTAFKAGKTIQYLAVVEESDTLLKDGKIVFHEQWKDIDSLEAILQCLISLTRLRVKPEPKLRPYKDAEEFAKASREHGEWFEHKNDSSYKFKSCSCGPDYIKYKRVVITMTECVTYNTLLDNFVWTDDGSPCGVLEEE